MLATILVQIITHMCIINRHININIAHLFRIMITDATPQSHSHIRKQHIRHLANI